MVRRAFDPKDILDSNEGMEKRWWLEEHNKLRRQQREDRSRRRRGEFARGGEEKQEDDDEDGLEEGPPDGTAKPETTPSCLEGTLPGESRSLSPFELMVQKQSATLPGPRCEVNATRERLKHFWMEQVSVPQNIEALDRQLRQLCVDVDLEQIVTQDPMLLIYNYSDAVDLARKTEQKRWNGSVIR
eukprot:gene2183-2889_t